MEGCPADVRPSDPFSLVTYNRRSDTGTAQGQAIGTIGLHATDCVENMAAELSENTRLIGAYPRRDA